MALLQRFSQKVSFSSAIQTHSNTFCFERIQEVLTPKPSAKDRFLQTKVCLAAVGHLSSSFVQPGMLSGDFGENSGRLYESSGLFMIFLFCPFKYIIYTIRYKTCIIDSFMWVPKLIFQFVRSLLNLDCLSHLQSHKFRGHLIWQSSQPSFF